MKNPSRTLINWVAIGLIVLFIWVLLAAIIAPRLREAAAGAGNLLEVTQTPVATEAATATVAGTYDPFAPTPALDDLTSLMLTAPTGAVMTTEQIDMIPANTRVRISTWGFAAGVFQLSIVTLDGQLTAMAAPEQLMLDPAWDAHAPTVVPRYGDYGYWSSCYPLELTEDIPVTDYMGVSTGEIIAAGTRVRVGTMSGTQEYREGLGYVWVYDVVTQPAVDTIDPNAIGLPGKATENQLALAPGVQIIAGGATPTSTFMNDAYGMNFVTTEDIGDLPAGSRVGIGSAYLNCDQWVYQIYVDGTTIGAWVWANQLTYAPDYTPGAPTPTYVMPEATATHTPYPGTVVGRTLGDPHTVLRSQPTLDPENVIAEVPYNSELIIIGRWVGYDWYLVEWSQSTTGQAWVYAPLVQLEGDITTVPAVTPMP